MNCNVFVIKDRLYSNKNFNFLINKNNFLERKIKENRYAF